MILPPFGFLCIAKAILANDLLDMSKEASATNNRVQEDMEMLNRDSAVLSGLDFAQANLIKSPCLWPWMWNCRKPKQYQKLENIYCRRAQIKRSQCSHLKASDFRCTKYLARDRDRFFPKAWCFFQTSALGSVQDVKPLSWHNEYQRIKCLHVCPITIVTVIR